MSNDYSMMEVIRKVSEEAERHQCTRMCPQDARGNPPAGYWEKAARFAAGIRYRLSRSWVPVGHHGYGCAGMTNGYVPPCPGCGEKHAPERQVYVTPGQPPAEEFSTVVHELTHAYLQHPATDAHDHQVKYVRRGSDKFHEEAQAELAAAAAGFSCGMDMSASICYLSNYIRGHRQRIAEEDQYAAFQAARVISGTLA